MFAQVLFERLELWLSLGYWESGEHQTNVSDVVGQVQDVHGTQKIVFGGEAWF